MAGYVAVIFISLLLAMEMNTSCSMATDEYNVTVTTNILGTNVVSATNYTVFITNVFITNWSYPAKVMLYTNWILVDGGIEISTNSFNITLFNSTTNFLFLSNTNSITNGFTNTNMNTNIITNTNTNLVELPNRSPTNDAGTNQTVEMGSVVYLSGTATDPDGDNLTNRWSVYNGPLVSFSDPDALNTTFVAPLIVGNMDFCLTTTDGEYSVEDTVNITIILTNRFPTANAGTNITVNGRETVQLQGSATDVDGDDLTYLWEQTSGTDVTLTDATTLTPSFTVPNADTTLIFRLSVSDGRCATTNSISVTVVKLPLFREINPGSLTALGSGSVKLGDIDGDGDFDAVITGSGTDFFSMYTKIYQNDGTGTFTEINAGSLTPSTWGDIVLTNIDGDTDTDLILCGNNLGTAFSKIYQNNGTGSFTEINPGSLTAVQFASMASGDIDGDNDVDLILIGDAGSELIAKIYQNDGTGSFTEINAGTLTAVKYGTVDLLDIDGDTDLDIILTGDETGSWDFIAKIYRNDGTGSFTEINPGTLMPLNKGAVDYGDIDGDNDLDLIFSGMTNVTTNSVYGAAIYRNNGSGDFTYVNPGSILGLETGELMLSDVDDDTDLDIVLVGSDQSLSVNQSFSKVYLNNGSGTFSELTVGTIPQMNYGKFDLGDLDGDSDIDFILAGNSDIGIISYILENTTY